MYEAGSSHLTGTGWFVMFCLWIVVALIWHGLRYLFTGSTEPKPEEPATDFSPFLKGLATGQAQTCWTAPVTAVTPLGRRVRQSRCCQRGHTSVEQAYTHAEQIRDRIERTGR